MKVLFRVDASYQIGAGHIMRCMVLAGALRQQGHAVTFICRELPGNYIFALQNKNFSVIPLPYHVNAQPALSAYPEHQQWLGVTVEMDIEQTLSYLTEKVDWLVVDHYALDAKWEKACRPFVKKIMAIDDLADRPHDSDLLLDQNYYTPAVNPYAGRMPSHCKTLVGPQYALLREEFSESRKKCAPRDKKIQRLMVSLGGNDISNGTQKVLQGIKQSDYRDLPVDVVLGATSQHKEAIEQWCAREKNYQLHCPSENMAEIMKNADLAIGAGGATTWERCCLGLPSLIVKVARNQEELINQGISANIFEYVGDIATLDAIVIAKKLNELASNPVRLSTISQNGMRLVDGLGVGRVVEALLTI